MPHGRHLVAADVLQISHIELHGPVTIAQDLASIAQREVIAYLLIGEIGIVDIGEDQPAGII